MVGKVKQQRVIISTKDLLTGQELIDVIKENKVEDYLIERIDKRFIYKTYPNGFRIENKPIDDEYIYIFVDREVKNG